ncbi:cilia- and flagella-associated protein 299 [Denticeps clupeoides]|uniref:Cilia- and flagella-associated protein 299 n=1 Tax=Denticeps clupeoides TaxID=299321 RepID=A0AAY4DYT9_9TELE|nr:cilia- and flagella-associated protein 299 [Denticeps clupeoides]
MAAGGSSGAATDASVTKFQTYEDFLDAQVTPLDLFYLEDKDLARQLVELGYRGSGEVLKREEFERLKAAEEALRLSNRTKKTLASAGRELKDNFLKALADREEANRNGRMATIIFIRDRNAGGQEISGYIDYSHRLKSEDFEPYFSGKKKLLPRPADLSFYNWETNVKACRNSPNYKVLVDNPAGLLFENQHDHKVLNVDPEAPSGPNSWRTALKSELYLQVVVFDHYVRRLLN